MSLQSDLKNRIRDRLHQWLKDSFDLYDMAGLNRITATRDILVCLLSCISGAFEVYGLTRDQVMEVMDKHVEYRKKSPGAGRGPVAGNKR